MDESKPAGTLRRGWTTGACATAAAKAAYLGWQTGDCPDPVEIVLPGGARPAFSLALTDTIEGGARVGVIKDAGDDPDVTHGALVIATVRAGAPGSGVTFRAGEGVVDDDIRLREGIQGMDREQAGIARACPDEPDRAGCEGRREAGEGGHACLPA